MKINNVQLIKTTNQLDFMRQSVARLNFEYQRSIYVDLHKDYEDRIPPDEQLGYLLEIDGSMHFEAIDNVKELLTDTLKIGENSSPKNVFINRGLLSLGLDKRYMETWDSVAHMCKWVKRYGMSMPDTVTNLKYLPADCYNGPFVLEYRKQCYQQLQSFDAEKLITFCDQKNPTWASYRAKGWQIEDFINWAKKELIYVQFKDLPTFNFPQSNRDYYRVFIEDDFADLRAATS